MKKNYIKKRINNYNIKLIKKAKVSKGKYKAYLADYYLKNIYDWLDDYYENKHEREANRRMVKRFRKELLITLAFVLPILIGMLTRASSIIVSYLQ